jgi:hypothetical protein
MPHWGEWGRDNFHEEYLCKVLSIDSPADKQTDSAIVSYEVLTVQCYLIPVTVIPVVQLYWDGVLPPYVDDEGNELGSSDQIYEEESQINDDDGEDQEDQEGREESEDMEEQETPWVALYRIREGQEIDPTAWREFDAEEWAWKAPRRRWLCRTASPVDSCVGLLSRDEKQMAADFVGGEHLDTAWRRARRCSGAVVKTFKVLLVWRSSVLMAS